MTDESEVIELERDEHTSNISFRVPWNVHDDVWAEARRHCTRHRLRGEELRAIKFFFSRLLRAYFALPLRDRDRWYDAGLEIERREERPALESGPMPAPPSIGDPQPQGRGGEQTGPRHTKGRRKPKRA